MGKVRVAIVGVGNCSCSFIQGLYYYRAVKEKGGADSLGLVRPNLGGYSVADIEVVAAFDVAETKVGTNLSLAIWNFPNDTFKFAQVPPLNVRVTRGPTLDGLGKYLSGLVKESSWKSWSESEIVELLLEKKVDVLINYLPVGSQEATEFYIRCALQAKCAVVNCIPVFIASHSGWQSKFKAAGVPIIGDDIKSQVGATIVHRVLASLFRDRGVKLDRTMQLNVGGNGDFCNLLERERLESKKLSKTEAVISVSGGVDDQAQNVHIGPSDYVRWLGDRKWAYMRLEGTGFGGVPINIELKLEVWDSPNSAGIVIDACRLAKLAMDRGLSGAIEAPSAYCMKRPPVQMDDTVAYEALEQFISAPNLAA